MFILFNVYTFIWLVLKSVYVYQNQGVMKSQQSNIAINEENIQKESCSRNLLFLYINDLSSNYYCRITYLWVAILQ